MLARQLDVRMDAPHGRHGEPLREHRESVEIFVEPNDWTHDHDNCAAILPL